MSRLDVISDPWALASWLYWNRVWSAEDLDRRNQVVRSKKFVTFNAINGKLPGIHVRWDEALQLPSNHDLHVVEVTDWGVDQRPRGRYWAVGFRRVG